MFTAENNILSITRAEEHPADVWGEFYIPPYFNDLSLKSATKSSYIIGKRGCGKTMLLKYLDYHTAFSSKRPNISTDEVSHIGIYWRVDTQFCNSLYKRGIEEKEWEIIFESYFALLIAVEIIRSIKAIARSEFQDFTLDHHSQIHFPTMQDFGIDYPNTPEALEAYLEANRRKFATWVSNISLTPKPVLPPGKVFLESLIEDVKALPGLNAASFYIYIDEVENLVPYQRRVLNTFLKHSQKPLVVNLASKDLLGETATTGSESINATHDFNLRNLDDLMPENVRKTFFAEVFLANLELFANKKDSKLLTILRDPSNIEFRTSDEAYRTEIFENIKTYFPSKSYKELAADSITEPRILKILQEKIKVGLANHNTKINLADFMVFTKVPEALLIIPALLHRHRHTPASLIEELELYQADKSSKFRSTWVDNNLVGSLLELYRPYGGVCPIYSGFETFCTMANYNLRNFLIISYKALEVAELSEQPTSQIPVEMQARATFEAADQLLREITTFGELGERLRMFVLRLGNIFRTLQNSPPMSEPEQNQFTINSGKRELSSYEQKFILEAKKYAILSESAETKTKGKLGKDILDFQLNPIYSPYFQISYRRKRKIELSVEDFHVLALGTEDEYKALLGILFKLQTSPKNQAELDL